MKKLFTRQKAVKIGIWMIAGMISCSIYAQTKTQNSCIKSTPSFLSADTPPSYIDQKSQNQIPAHPVLPGSHIKTGNSLNSVFVTIIESESYNSGHIMDSNW